MDGFFFPHRCTITRPNPDDTRLLDEESGQPIGEPPAPVIVYSGRCCFDGSAQSVRREMGGDVDVAGKATLRLPKVGAGDLGSPLFDQDADEAEVSANGRQFDGATLAKVSYHRRGTVLVIDLKNRPSLLL